MKTFPCIDAGGYRHFGFKQKEKIHLGYDFNCPIGSTVHAIGDGIVVFSDKVNGFGSYDKPGWVVIVKHIDKYDHEFLALYGHISNIVKEGHTVKKGEIIGIITMYETTQFRADHLHFGINTHTDKIPCFPWGYDVTTDGWCDPVNFIETHL